MTARTFTMPLADAAGKPGAASDGASGSAPPPARLCRYDRHTGKEITHLLEIRPAAAIEGIAYFTVSELLQNISKHSGATKATVDVWRVEDRLLLQVGDDGMGGATISTGSGLRGLAERLDAVDGILVIDSPAGGPSRITAELPWQGPAGESTGG
jgi:signal transduction histidine kinase